MGFNTAVIVRNDFLHEVRDDAQFGQKVYDAISASGHRPSGQQSFQALPSQHADTAQIIVIAANSIRIIGYGTWTQTDEQLLRSLANQMGFRISRKPSKERQS